MCRESAGGLRWLPRPSSAFGTLYSPAVVVKAKTHLVRPSALAQPVLGRLGSQLADLPGLAQLELEHRPGHHVDVLLLQVA